MDLQQIASEVVEVRRTWQFDSGQARHLAAPRAALQDVGRGNRGSDVRAIRVLIADLPDLQADVLATLVRAEPDMVVVGGGAPAPFARVTDLEPDVVIVSPRQLALALTDSDQPPLVGLGRPGVGVLAVDAASGTIVQAVVVPEEPSWPDKVVAAIRTATPPERDLA